MKRLIVPVSLLFLIACGNSENKPAEEKKEETPAAPAEPVDITKNPDYQKGLELISKSDCFTCHSVTDKINGPAYKEVAQKYANAGDTIVSHLADKILSGGSGVWGEIPMIPHPALSKADAEAMVKYVLLLK